MFRHRLFYIARYFRNISSDFHRLLAECSNWVLQYVQGHLKHRIENWNVPKKKNINIKTFLYQKVLGQYCCLTVKKDLLCHQRVGLASSSCAVVKIFIVITIPDTKIGRSNSIVVNFCSYNSSRHKDWQVFRSSS